MAQFIARIEGQRGEVSRLGSKKSGITAVVNGWNSGVVVKAYYNGTEDVIDVYETQGSNYIGEEKLFKTIKSGRKNK